MRTCLRVAVAAACVLGLTGARAGVGARTAASPPGRPALWRTYDIIVNLQNLPRTYTCDQLWYEFHGLLLRLGAWPYSLNILPYDCSPTPSGLLKSPNVEVRFQLPIFLTGVAVKSAPAEAFEGTVRLAPGEPKTLHASDCQLLQQIDQTLLASITAHIDAEQFDCSGSPRQRADFNVKLTLPMAVKMPAAASGATTSARGPH
jgi:hypothetical protein